MSTVIHAAGRALVPAADFLSPYDFFRDLTNSPTLTLGSAPSTCDPTTRSSTP